MSVNDESSTGEGPVMPVSPGGSEPGRKLAPQHLRDMRRVYKHPESADETSAQKAMRKLMVDDFSKFIGMLQSAEKLHAGGRADRGRQDGPGTLVPVPEGEDEGTEAALAVYERCLRDFQPGGK